MSGKVGSIDPYNETEEDFDSYCSRVNMYFVANDIKDEKKVAAFFTLAGPKVFGLARDLLSPAKPEESTFDVILKTLKQYYKPKPVLIYERYKFYSRSQKSGESVNDFVVALKALAHTCDFGTTLSEMLRDRFVMGLFSDKIQQVLLAESDLTFDKAVSMATAREIASKDVQAMSSGSVHYVPGSQSGPKKKNSTFSSKNRAFGKSKSGDTSSSSVGSNTPKTPCTGCGKLHWKRECPFKNATCHACKQKGHIKKVCFQSKSKPTSEKAQTKSNVNFAECNNLFVESTGDPSYDYVYSVGGARADPIVLDVLLNTVRVPMELDTGATCTLIPRSQYERLWPVTSERPVLGSSSVALNAYGGIPLKIAGEIDVAARLENGSEVSSARVVVVDGEGPCLLGRDLIRRLGLLKSIHKVTVSADSIRQEFPELFSEGLGCYRGRQFTIEVDPSVTPKFCKARTVPYTLRAKVDQELDRLQKEGIISPVTNSSWAAAVVPVVKPNNKIDYVAITSLR